MRYLTLRKVTLALASLVSVGVLTACANTNVPYRDYYVDRTCHVYYVDQFGNRVYDGRYDRADYSGLTMQRDANGRWFYEDSWGNRIYKSKHCGQCHRF